MKHPFRFLVAESEPPKEREERRASTGRSAAETYEKVLRDLVPNALCDQVRPVDSGSSLPDGTNLADYDAVFVTGSSLHVYEDTPEIRREIDFTRSVLASGTPAFGSCAGLQLAVAALGGSIRPSANGPECGFARRVTPTAAGLKHPMMSGRPPAFDVPSFHSDEVETLPAGATVLASNTVTAVQAVEFKTDTGLFWGVQYHPELSLREVADALRRQVDGLAEAGVGEDAVLAQAELIEALHDDPSRSDLVWRLGLDDQVVDETKRLVELRNFVTGLVPAHRSERGRG